MMNWNCACGRNKHPTASTCLTCSKRDELKEQIAALDGEK